MLINLTNKIGIPILAFVLCLKASDSSAQTYDSCLNYYHQGKYEKVVGSFEVSPSLAGPVQDSVDLMDAVTTSYIHLGRLADAEKIIRQVLKQHAARQEAVDPLLATAYNNLGLVFEERKEFDSSLYYLHLGLNARLKISSPESEMVSESYFNLGSVYARANDYDKAEQTLIKSLEIDLKNYGPDNAFIGGTYNQLAELSLQCGRIRIALEYYNKEALIFANNPGTNSFEYASIMYNKMNCFYLLNQPDSMKYYLDLSSRLMAGKSLRLPEVAAIKRQLVRMWCRMGELKRAALVVDAMEKELSESNDFEKFVYPYYYHAKAILNLYTGNPEEALKFSEQAVSEDQTRSSTYQGDIWFDQRCDILMHQKNFQRGNEEMKILNKKVLGTMLNQFPSFSEKEREQYFHLVKKFFEKYNSLLLEPKLLPGVASEAFNNQLATKAILLNYTNRWKRQMLRSGDAQLKEDFVLWQKMKADVQKVVDQADNTQAKKIDSLNEALNKIEKRLSSRSELFARKTDKQIVTWQEVQKKLKKNEAVVELIRFRPYDFQTSFEFKEKAYYAALIITKKTLQDPEVVIFPDGDLLEGRVIKNYRISVTLQQEDTMSYNALWKPLQTKLKGIKKVYVSPDGIFNLINFNTLRNPATGKYLIEEIDLRKVSNSRDLVMIKEKTVPSQYASIIGGPDFKAAASDVSPSKSNNVAVEKSYYSLSLERGMTLSNLPGALEEARNLERLFKEKNWQVDYFVGAAASEENLKHTIKPKVLHIATHGYFQKDLTGNDNFQSTENPLTRSGLLLAGAATTLKNRDEKIITENREDGILTAYEAMDLNLENTELVVLSACETGLGEVQNGEGVYGLQRAFQVAGAQAVIVSLWKVDDEVTQKLMKLFYTIWLSGKSKEESFHTAQLKIKTEHPHPYYWGAFVLVGQ